MSGAKNQASVQGARALAKELVSLWPSLPYLGFGVWVAWASLTYSGTLWLSENEVNGTHLSHLYVVSTAFFAVVCLIAPYFVQKMKRALASKRVIIGAGVLTGVGCFFIVLAGPFYLSVHMDAGILFWAGALMTGVGTGIIGLKCGELYGELSPRKVLIYGALSQLVVAFIYFAVIGSPSIEPVEGGPSWVGILSFTLLPLAASLLLVIPRQERNAREEKIVYSENPKMLPKVFWRLVALSFVLPLATSMIRAFVVNEHALAVTLEGSNILMLLRIVMALGFVLVGIRLGTTHLNLGKVYSLLAIFMVAAIACVPVFGVLSTEWSILIYFASSVFEFVTWCLLAFVVFQKRISAIIVFGYGRGAFMLGSALGWLLGIYVLPDVVKGSQEFSFFLIVAAVVLVLSFILFTERDFERLFSPINESELSLETLLDGEDITQKEDKNDDKKGHFSQAVENLSEQSKLSAREREVFRYLAMGRGSEYVADKLQVSWNTARTHTHNVYVKLGVHSRQELMDLVDQEIKAPLNHC